MKVENDPECLGGMNPKWEHHHEHAILRSTRPIALPREAARYLTNLGMVTAPQTLARKFHESTGPLCTHLGDRAMYRKSHLDTYFANRLSAPRKSSGEPRRTSVAG
ncbi:MAG: hypothetical protein AB7Q23_08930 [Hyphomonadaceae bacterium]